MSIIFNNIPNSVRTPGAYVEIDNSRALKGLVANPHKALIIGQRIPSISTIGADTIKQITSNGLADGFFGTGSVLARMCNTFKKNNPNMELHAVAISVTGGTQAKCIIKFASGLSATSPGTYYLMINGQKVYTTIASAWSITDINSAIKDNISADLTLPVYGSTSASAAGSDHLVLMAKVSGTLGNYIMVRANYYQGQSNPPGFSTLAIAIGTMAAGATDPNVADVWPIIDNEQYQYIISPYIDAANLTSLEDELTDRFRPLEDLQGMCFTAVRATLASCSTLGNSRNSPFVSIMGCLNSPTSPEEMAAAYGAVAAWNLQNDPARPLHFLKLVGVLPPETDARFTRSERDILLYDGISTYVVDSGGNFLIERALTTYQKNALGTPDPSYLDVTTLATLAEIRFQFKTRMINRFVIPRFKLADDSFPVQPGTYVCTPKTVKSEIIALFTQLQSEGLIENLADFIANLVVERDDTDRNRVNVLLPPDLINQFMVLAGKIEFIL